MNNIIRNIALFIRRRSEQKQIPSVLRQYDEWRLFLEAMPSNSISEKKVAIVRLDDIGDYLLWRNCLAVYKHSEKYARYKITLIGNVVWKPIFEAYDASCVADTIWVDKQQYFSGEDYRKQLWQNIRLECFDTIICPSRTRPLLLDDLIVLASGAPNRIACENSYEWQVWNSKSDEGYTKLLPRDNTEHEFNFNSEFAASVSGLQMEPKGPWLPKESVATKNAKQIICFIGTAAKSKTWPLENWIELVKLLQQIGLEPLLSGGKNELQVADKIVAATQVKSIVGQTNLVATINAIGCAAAVITGDTMAAHASVSLQKPTVILANGVNAKRFVAYEEAGYPKVKTVFTKQYLRSNKELFYKAVSKDMQSIEPQMIVDALVDLLR